MKSQTNATGEGYTSRNNVGKWVSSSHEWEEEDDDNWFQDEANESPQPQFPLRYENGGRNSIRDVKESYLEEAEAAAQVDYEIIDWVFKCVTITLLALILLCVSVILIKVWSPPTVVHTEEGALKAVSFGSSVGGELKYDHRNPDDYFARNGSVMQRMLTWVGKSAFGKTGARLISLPAYMIRSCVCIVLAPLRFICSKLVYFLYICGFMFGMLLVLYWVVHAFLAQTLGDWFMQRLKLPAPKQLVHDFFVFVGYAFFNRWWSLTELIKERVIGYFNTIVIEGDRFGERLGAFGANANGIGSTPNPMRRRNNSIWGGAAPRGPYGTRASVASNRNSVNYPKTNVYTGLASMDQKRRLQTITETNPNYQDQNRAGFRQFERTAVPTLQNRIHSSPRNNHGRHEMYNFENYEKENDEAVYRPTYTNKFNPGLANPLSSQSPRQISRTNSGVKFGGNVAQRQVQRQQNTKTNVEPPGATGRFLGLGGARNKRGGMAFNIN